MAQEGKGQGSGLTWDPPKKTDRNMHITRKEPKKIPPEAIFFSLFDRHDAVRGAVRG